MAVSQSLSVTQSSQSVANNTSQVRIRWTSTQSGESWNGNTRTAYYYISINGGSETRYSVSYTLPMGTTKTIVDKTITVNHKADGTGRITVRTWMDTDISAGVIEKSQSLTMDTIPRATTPTMSNPTMGNTVTISLPRASSSFTHTLTYKFGSASGTIATGAGSSASWSVPLSLANQVPNATSGSGTVTCKTYSGGSLVGTKTINFTASVPSSVKPSISSVSISEATSGLASKFHAYVQGKSTLSVTVSASGDRGSTIKSYLVTILGVKYTSRTFTSKVLDTSGSVTVATTVTDSRGRTASHAVAVSVQPYTKPKINGLNVYRVNSAGAAYDDGNLVAVAMNYEISQVGGYNDHTYTLEYKKANQPDSSYTVLRSGSASWTYKDTVKFLSGPTFLVNNTYKIRLTVADYFTSAVRVFDLPSAFTIMDFRSTGKGMAIGKVSEKDELEVAMDADFQGDLKLDGKSFCPRNISGEFTPITTTASDHSVTLRYFPALGIVYFHLYVKLGDKAVSATTPFNIGTISTGYGPAQQEALAAYCGKMANATVQTDGTVRMTIQNAISAGNNYFVYLTGVWRV